MTKHIYRGYEYDPETKGTEVRNPGEHHADLIYRGVHHESARVRSQESIKAPASPLWYRGYRFA